MVRRWAAGGAAAGTWAGAAVSGSPGAAGPANGERSGPIDLPRGCCISVCLTGWVVVLQAQLPRLAGRGATQALGADTRPNACQLAIAPEPLPAGHPQPRICTWEE